jgi:PadR family transcriptional regulator PadR
LRTYVVFFLGACLSSSILLRYNLPMAEVKLSHTAAMILQAISAGHIYGFSVMEVTGLPSGTVYPAMRRLERDRLILSQWEKQPIADAEGRPPRKYYKLTGLGRTTLEASRRRYPLLAKLVPAEEVETA